MERKVVQVDELLLWLRNPRVDYAEDQIDEISKIYNYSNINSQSTSRRQMMNLAESIATNGYQNEVEPILVAEEDGELVVHDANRRIACIKLLRDPQKYKDVLSAHDLKRLQKLADTCRDNIPDCLEVLVFQENEEKELKEILARKHDGPQDGSGTLPWPSAAKTRFFGKDNPTTKLEERFAEQYGQSLTSYMGGSNAVTSTSRVFNSRPVKEYLDIRDMENITEAELDKVKDLADATKAFIQESEIQLSRLRISDIQDEIIKPLETRNQPKPTPEEIAKETARKFVNQHSTKLNLQLGGRYNEYKNIDFDNEDATALNLLLSALMEYGKLPGDYRARFLKAYLLAPGIRVLYELALLVISKAGFDDITLPSPNVSINMEENVSYVHDLFKNDKKFIKFLYDSCHLFDTYHEANSVIRDADFGRSVDQSNLPSHKTIKDLDVDTIVHLFNDGVLFALVSEQYVLYKNQNNEDSR